MLASFSTPVIFVTAYPERLLTGERPEPAFLITKPFQPEIRGKLFTGGKPLYLSATVVGGEGFNSEVSDTPPWPVDDKIVAEELGPYLAALDNR